MRYWQKIWLDRAKWELKWGNGITGILLYTKALFLPGRYRAWTDREIVRVWRQQDWPKRATDFSRDFDGLPRLTDKIT